MIYDCYRRTFINIYTPLNSSQPFTPYPLDADHADEISAISVMTDTV
jgi:hypothetical protein